MYVVNVENLCTDFYVVLPKNSSFMWLHPLTPTRGSAPGPCYRLALHALAICPQPLSSPLFGVKLRPWVGWQWYCMWYDIQMTSHVGRIIDSTTTVNKSSFIHLHATIKLVYSNVVDRISTFLNFLDEIHKKTAKLHSRYWKNGRISGIVARAINFTPRRLPSCGYGSTQ